MLKYIILYSEDEKTYISQITSSRREALRQGKNFTYWDTEKNGNLPRINDSYLDEGTRKERRKEFVDSRTYAEQRMAGYTYTDEYYKELLARVASGDITQAEADQLFIVVIEEVKSKYPKT